MRYKNINNVRIPLTPEEEALEDAQWAEFQAGKSDRDFNKLRFDRDLLLTGSDWRILPDSPLSEADKEAWRVYRQALRDLPDNTSDPENPVWPVEPS